MARYTRLEEKDVQEISAAYDLKVLSFDPIEGGHGNSSYLLNTADNEYVLTVFDDKSFAYVKLLAKLLLHLGKHAYPTTRLVNPKNQDSITTYLNKPVMVKEYIPGEVRSDLAQSILGQKMLRQTGSAMAKLHQVPAPGFLAKQHSYGRQLFSSVASANIDLEYEAWLAEQAEHLENNLPADLPSGLIHGDLFYDNVLFEGEDFKAVIDFEEACHHPFVFDIGMGMVGLCRVDETIDLTKAKAFVQGYQNIRPLEAEEKAALQLFVEYAATTTSYWRFWKYNIHKPMPENAAKHRAMMEIAQEVKKIPAEEFVAQVTLDFIKKNKQV